MAEFLNISTESEYVAAGKLFREYAEWLNIDLSFQHFDKELEEIKTMYSLPFGGIVLCKLDDKYIGCVGLRKIDEQTGEIKRMYLQPEFQHSGLGTALLEKILALAKKIGYTSVRLDTLKTMIPAMNFYKKYGFVETESYYHNPLEAVVYFQKYL